MPDTPLLEAPRPPRPSFLSQRTPAASLTSPPLARPRPFVPVLAPLPAFPPSGPSPNARGVGSWRLRPGGEPWPGLPEAIAAVRHAMPDRRDLQALAFVLMPRMPGKPLASDSLKTGKARSDRMPLEDVVLTHPWLGMNTAEVVNVLWTESDRPGFRERLERAMAAGLPRPAWRAYGAVGGHAAWILRTPVALRLDGDLGRGGKMTRLLSVTHSYLTTAVDGDHGAALRGMTKNPWHPSWTVEVDELAVHDLKAILLPLKAQAEAEGWEAPKRRTRASREREPSPEGRNCALFDLLRWWAGDHGERDGAAILDKAMELNAGFALPLGYGEAACVARSVTRGVADGRCVGRRRLSPAQARARQATAGQAVARTRADDRDGRVRAALATLGEQGAPVTKAAVAALAGCDPRTVARSPAWAEARGGVTHAPPLSGSSESPAPIPPSPCCAPRLPVLSAASVLVPGPAEAPSGFLRVVGDGPGIDPRFLPRRARAALARHEREAWHRQAAGAGLRAYSEACAGRRRALHAERRTALDELGETANRLAERLAADLAGDMWAVVAAQERLRLATLAWASRVKAEERAEERHRQLLGAGTGIPAPRLRTVLGSLDLVAAGLPRTDEQAKQEAGGEAGARERRAVRERARRDGKAEVGAGERLAAPRREEPAPLSLMALPDPEAQAAWERSRRRAA